MSKKLRKYEQGQAFIKEGDDEAFGFMPESVVIGEDKRPEQFGKYVAYKRDNSPITTKVLRPLVLGAMGGAGGAIGGLIGESINTGIASATKGRNETWGDWLTNNKLWKIQNDNARGITSAVLDFTNPGYLVGAADGLSNIYDTKLSSLRGGAKDLIGNYKTNAEKIKELTNFFNKSLKDGKFSNNQNYGARVMNVGENYGQNQINDAISINDYIRNYYDKNIVRPDGSINNRQLTKAYRDLLRTLDDNGLSIKQRLNQKYNSSGKNTTLKKHLADVTSSAQSIPVPEGSTRADLVRAALVHDLGKMITGQELLGSATHGSASRDLIEKMIQQGYEEFDNPDMLNAIQYHMFQQGQLPQGIYGKHGIMNLGNGQQLNIDFLKALMAADASRGLPYDQAAFANPYLFTYNKQGMPVINLSGGFRDQLKNIVNPLLERQGYDTIDLNKPKKAIKQLNEFAHRHRSQLRSGRDPKKEHGDVSDMMNETNASILEEMRGLEDTPENRTLVSLENIPLGPTGSGRRGLFDVGGDALGRIHHRLRHTPHSDENTSAGYLKVDPDYEDALYMTPDLQFARGYKNSTDNRYSVTGVVELPFEEYKPGESPAEFYNRVNYQMYGNRGFLDKSEPKMAGTINLAKKYPTKGSPKSSMSTYQAFEEPYRLQTGRSLQQDLAEDLQKRGIEKIKEIIPEENKEGLVIENEGTEFEKRWYKQSDIEYHGIRTTVARQNELKEKYNIDYINADRKYKEGNDAYKKFYTILNDLDSLPDLPNEYKKTQHDKLQIYIYTSSLKTFYNFTDKELKLFKKIINIVDYNKKLKAINKYFPKNKVIERFISRFNKENRNYVTLKYGIDPDFTDRLKDPDTIIEFMRRKGVSPAWEMPGFGEEEVFINVGHYGDKPTTKSRKIKNVKSPQSIVIGQKGEKKLRLRQIIDNDVKSNKELGLGRDYGKRDYSPLITRKTFKLGGKSR